MAGLLGYAAEQDDETVTLTEQERMALELLAAQLASNNPQSPPANILQQMYPQMRLGYRGEPTFSASIPNTPLRAYARPFGMNPGVSLRGRVDF
jgi:hypothetical protein